jgi:hypothetical protein
MTANPDRSLCLNADMDDFLFKPVMLTELDQLLKKWLGKDESPTSKVNARGDALPSKVARHAGSSVQDAPVKSIEPKFGIAASTASASTIESSLDSDPIVMQAGSEINSSLGCTDTIEPTDASALGTVIE